METYRNSYTKEEDRLLWELHEIRHRLHARRQHRTIEEINREALKKYAMWQQERERQQQEAQHHNPIERTVERQEQQAPIPV
jgi:hypothetical protein